MNKTSVDIPLKREDVVSIASKFDLRNEYIVSINGEIRNGGDFPYAEKMTVEDLVIQAGGFTESASASRIAIARRITDSDPTKKNSAVSQLFSINVDEQFKLNASSFILQPFDVVTVYTLPGYEKQRTVKIEGEVIYPGPFTITTRDERVSDLIKRAGGFTASADIDGGRLKRTDKLGVDAEKSKTNVAEFWAERLSRLSHIQKTLRDSTTNVYEQVNNDYVGINLKEILKKPGSPGDLILEDGDVLRIPKQQQLVKVSGEVLFPSSVVFSNSNGLSGFVNNAGGFSPNALKRRAYVVYANGSVKATHNFLLFKSYPTIKPGSEIVIPKRPPVKGLTAGEIAGIAGTLGSAAAVLIGVLSLVRR
jgi:protein involved in polysaccharide export with SLBB domain